MNRHLRSSRRYAAPPRSGVVVALSGGGAHGAAQAGMLQALFDAGIVPDAYVGCSVGALNAVFMAARPDAARARELVDVWTGLATRDVFGSRSKTLRNLLAGRNHLLDPSSLRALINRCCPVDDLADLTTPTHVVTTDLVDGSPTWWTTGPARDILLASTALPALFPPVALPHAADGARRHVDGGVASPVPVARAASLAAKTVYVLDVSNWKQSTTSGRSPLGILLRSFDISRYSNLADPASFAAPGQEIVVLPCPNVSGAGITDFSRSRQLIADARRMTERVLADRTQRVAA
jgi:NTE family protein